MTIPTNFFNVIFGICVSRATKSVLTKGFIALLRFLHCLIFILYIRAIIKNTIVPAIVSDAIFGICALRAFKLVLAYWRFLLPFLDFSHFIDIFFIRTMTRKLSYRKMFSMSFSESGRQEFSKQGLYYDFTSILLLFTYFSKITIHRYID